MYKIKFERVAAEGPGKGDYRISGKGYQTLHKVLM